MSNHLAQKAGFHTPVGTTAAGAHLGVVRIVTYANHMHSDFAQIQQVGLPIVL